MAFLVRHPEHAAHFDAHTSGYSPQQPIAGQQNAVFCVLCQREGKAVIESKPPVLIEIALRISDELSGQAADFEAAC